MNLLGQALLQVEGAGPELELRLRAYAELLSFYNTRFNLISRSDVSHLAEHHLAHCVTLARRSFPQNSVVVDWGTGGGLPLFPLALAFPEISFIGVDAVAKKVQAVRQMARSLEVSNVDVWHGRAEQFSTTHTHSVSRATAPLNTLWGWHRQNAIQHEWHASEWPSGLLCLKGGDLKGEIDALVHPAARISVEPVGINDPYFADKYVVSVRE